MLQPPSLFLFCLHLPRLPMLISTDIVSINQVNCFNRFPFVSRWRLKVESVDLVVQKRIDPNAILISLRLKNVPLK